MTVKFLADRSGRRLAPLLLGAALATPQTAAAAPPVLDLPLDCTLGTDCYIQQYVDRDTEQGQRDFACGSLANDGHTGTDFALPTIEAMQSGVAVLAAAPGEVRRLRDGMPDIDATAPLAPNLTDRECGNGVAIRHPGGWETQYCHLREGSVTVQEGQQVEAGTPLGLVGMSGLATFPHLHFSIRHGKHVIDPFRPDMALACGLDDVPGLWREAIAYRPGGLLATGILDRIPDYDEVKTGLPAVGLPNGSPDALVVWGYLFGGQKGDVVDIALVAPDGHVQHERSVLDEREALFYRAWGKRAPAGGFARGMWTGQVTHRRDGNVVDRRRVTFTLR